MNSQQNPHVIFRSFLDEVNNVFIDRRAEIEVIGTALVAEENCVLVGPPGTAKSLLAETFAKAMKDKYFEYLISRYTTPDELLGHFSLKQLKDNDMYVRKFENKLPDCTVAFLDEVFKASSALLNSLLTILNERKVDLGNGVRIKTPLSMVIGASNEYPFNEESLGALWDRWLFRRHVSLLKKPKDIIRLMTDQHIGKTNAVLCKDTLLFLREKRDKVSLDLIHEELEELIDFLRNKEIVVSDRRWRKVTKVVQARAIMDGRSVAKPKDLKILSEVLWNKPEQRDDIVGFLTTLCSGDVLAVMALHDAAKEMLENTDVSTMTTLQSGQASRNMKRILSEAKEYSANNDPEIDEYIDRIDDYTCDLLRKISNALDGS